MFPALSSRNPTVSKTRTVSGCKANFLSVERFTGAFFCLTLQASSPKVTSKLIYINKSSKTTSEITSLEYSFCKIPKGLSIVR